MQISDNNKFQVVAGLPEVTCGPPTYANVRNIGSGLGSRTLEAAAATLLQCCRHAA